MTYLCTRNREGCGNGMADGMPEGARLRLENPSESAGPGKADEKNFRENLEGKRKSSYLCSRNSQ